MHLGSTRALPVLALLAALASPALAKTVVVEPEGDSPVAAAVAELVDGDRLVFRPGVYTERLVLDGLTDVRVLRRGRGEVVFTPSSSSAPSIQITGCTRVSLTRVVVRDSTANQGIGISSSEGVSLSRCAVESLDGIAVVVSAPSTVKVTRCTFSDVRTGFTASGDSVAVVRGCAIDGEALVTGFNLATITEPGTRISGNRIDGASGNAVTLGGPGILVDRNLIEDCAFGVVALSSKDLTGTIVRRNRIFDSTLIPVRLLSGGATVTRNRISGAPVGTAVQCGSASEPTVVTANVIRDTRSGVDVESANAVVSRNRVTTTTNYAIRVRGGAGTSCSANLLLGNLGDGFAVWTGGHTFTRNTARNNAGTDFTSRVAAEELTLVRNRFQTSDL